MSRILQAVNGAPVLDVASRKKNILFLECISGELKQIRNDCVIHIPMALSGDAPWQEKLPGGVAPMSMPAITAPMCMPAISMV